MFTHLRISNIKGLKECTLLNLGNINVICGKNSSGKSTILEGIIQLGNRAYGKDFLEDEIEMFYKTTLAHTQWQDRDENKNLIYHRIIQEIMRSKTWYSDEDIVFTSSVRDDYKSYMNISSYMFPEVPIASAYRSFFSSPPKTILLPPKRNPDLTSPYRADQPVQPDGQLLSDYLFFAKNQHALSEDRIIYTQISGAFNTISSGHSFDVFLGTSGIVHVDFSYLGKPWVSAAHSGLGLQDLLAILYFAIHPDYEIVLIEEPESHMHPDMQRKLLAFFKQQIQKQFFLSTHSNVFLDNTFVDRVFYTRFDENVQVDDATSRASILNDLGYSVTDNLVSDLIILVEGPSDTPIIEEFLLKMEVYPHYDIKIWPLGGDIMDQIDLSVFSQKYVIVALIDNDPGSESVRKKFITNCQNYGISVYRLERYSIENYFSLEALREVFSTQIPVTVEVIDPNIKLEDQIGINVKKRNRKIAQHMTLTDIEGTDLYDFFEKVKSMCQQPPPA